jgi:hypothetical protein
MEAVHQEVPKEHAAVETGRWPNKQHRGWNFAAECCHKLKDRSWRKLVAVHRGTTHLAKVAQCKGNTGKNQTRDKVVQGNLKGWMFGKKHWTGLECKIGIKNPGPRQQLRLKIERTSEGFNRKAFRLEFVK